MRRWLLRGLVVTWVAGIGCYEVTDLAVVEPGASSDVVPCVGRRSYGDGLGGLNCWEPPANVCAVPGGPLWDQWFCKADGSHCCRVSAACFRCGWIEMDTCRDQGAEASLDPAVCAAIRAKLPVALAACMVEVPGPDCVLPDPQAGADPACVIDTTEGVCP